MCLNKETEEHNSLTFLTMANTQPYYETELITAAKSFTVPASEMWLCEGVEECNKPLFFAVTNALA
jgi:hypothetical protein